MTNEQVIKANIDAVRNSVLHRMNETKLEMKRLGDLGMYGEADRLKWMAEGMGLAVLQLGEQIGLDATQSLRPTPRT